MIALFERAWALRITRPGNSQALLYENDYSQGTPLRFAFSVERTLHSDANKAEITLTNLSEADRQCIGLGSLVQLRAGYGRYPGIIFLGHVADLKTTREGPDINLALLCGDGEPYLQSGFVSLSYTSTTTLARILQDICASLSIEIGGQVFTYGSHLVQRVPKITLPRRVISGPVKKVLDDLLHPLQIQWSIQCGTLLIQYNQGVVSLQATVLSPATGLLGAPSRTKGGVSCSALLQSSIAPGSAVQITGASPGTNGNFRVVSAKYSGDTAGQDWTVEVQGEALEGKTPLSAYSAPSSQGAFDAAAASDDEDSIDQEAIN